MARKKAAAVAKAPKPLYEDYGQLLYAIWHDPSALQRHLDAGVGINTPDPRGHTLLYLACGADAEEMLSKGSDTLVKQLLQAGADPNLAGRDGFTPLMVTNSCNTANSLLDHGADIERESNQGSTALEQACAGGRRPVIKVLLKRGAAGQILQASKSGHTPLSAAVTHGHEEITLLLLQQLVTQSSFDIDHPRLALNQPLLCSAAVSGLSNVAEFALEHGADPNAAGPDGPALILAVKHRHDSVVSLLCERGANVQTRFGPLNSLDQAVKKGDVQIVKTLIKHGADVNVSADSRQGSAVVKAAVLGKCDIVQLLFEAGATLDAALQHDTLTICCNTLEDSKAVKVVKVLLPHCSSLAENNFEFGHKILAHAVCKGKLQVAHLLHAAGVDVHHTDRFHNGVLMHSAAASGNLAIVKWLQTLGLDARALCVEGQLLPLYYACEHQHLHIVKYLVAVPGAADDIHARSSEQETPLHGAAAHGADSVVQLLLQRGADVDARDINE
jgi:ankyrin repeat protein